jgi:ribosomal protein S14
VSPTLPRVGESLDPALTLAAQARKMRRAVGYDHTCDRCGLSPYPRGYIVNLGLCWTCGVPRPKQAPVEEGQP